MKTKTIIHIVINIKHIMHENNDHTIGFFSKLFFNIV